MNRTQLDQTAREEEEVAVAVAVAAAAAAAAAAVVVAVAAAAAAAAGSPGHWAPVTEAGATARCGPERTGTAAPAMRWGACSGQT